MNIRQITIENANIITGGNFRNFKGEAGQYNQAGDRNFVMILPDDIAKKLSNDGWPVKWKPSYHGDGEEGRLKVHVKYVARNGKRMKPPKIVLVSSNGMTELTEETVGMLDDISIQKADLILNAYEYQSPFSGQTDVGVSLQTMFVTMQEDELTAKYMGGNAQADEDMPF